MLLNNSKFLTGLIVGGSLLIVAGCTTSNQQALGVGVEPAPATASADPAASGDASTQSALAPTSGEAVPSVAAATGVAEPEKPAPVVNEIARVGFLPITGAPQSAVSLLSKALGTVSKQHNIGIAGASDQSVGYRLKGYMSALNEGSRTTVTFYWDVLDPSGKRLYRINGFEQEKGARKDPWQGVSNATIQRIANRTMGSFAQWVKRKGA